MAIETQNVDTIYSSLHFLKQEYGKTEKKSIGTERDPLSKCVIFTNKEEINIPVEVQLGLNEYQDITEMSSIIL